MLAEKQSDTLVQNELHKIIIGLAFIAIRL